jgi:GNAT superfamily N-acetyltransferase
MAVVELHDREEIAALCRRSPAVHAYELGDLDDFFWPHTRWFGWEDGAGVTQVALLYEEHELPVLIALPQEPRADLGALLEELLAELPPRVYAHVGADVLSVLGRRFEPEAPAQPHLKMGLVEPERLDVATDGVVPLRTEELGEIETFYAAAYPGTWFVPRMLETGRYVGIRDERGLACVAGVHVWSPRWRVAALGNVATRPDARGHCLAQRACAALCRRLLDDGIDTIALNVKADNAPAIRAYGRLGFAVAAEYVEVLLTTRG